MQELLASSVLLFAGAISPGPNNLAVLHVASRNGMRRALPAIGGIVSGSLMLCALAALGAVELLARHPWLRSVLTASGVTCLAVLGLRLMLAAGTAPAHARAPSPARILRARALFGLQLVNPKAWVMALTATTAWPGAQLSDYLPLAVPFTLIPAACLLLWAALGASLAHAIARPAIRRRCDTAMGLLLLASAGMLLLHR